MEKKEQKKWFPLNPDRQKRKPFPGNGSYPYLLFIQNVTGELPLIERNDAQSRITAVRPVKIPETVSPKSD